MSIEFDLEDDGKVRVRVDREGERAVSDTIDPYEMIKNICEAADITCVVGDQEMHVLLPIDHLGDSPDDGATEVDEPSKIDESAPPEPPAEDEGHYAPS